MKQFPLPPDRNRPFYGIVGFMKDFYVTKRVGTYFYIGEFL